MKKSERLKPRIKIKSKYFILAHILTLFFVLFFFLPTGGQIALAEGNSFDFSQESAYSEPFSKLIEFLDKKKNELAEKQGDFLKKEDLFEISDGSKTKSVDEKYPERSAPKFSLNFTVGGTSSSLLSAVFESVKSFVVDKPKIYLGTIMDSAKNFVFPGPNQNDFEYNSPKSLSAEEAGESTAREMENLKQQYAAAIDETKAVSQKFNLLQTELGKIKNSGVIVREPVIEQRVVERTIEKIISGLSQTDLDSGLSNLRTELQNLNTNLLNQINTLSASSNRQTSAVYQAVSLTNKIDSLSGTRLSNITVSGVSGLADADIPDTITASNYLLLSGGTMTGNLLMPASAYLNFGTDSGSSGYGLRDNGGTMQFKNSSGSWTTISPAYWGNNGSSIYYNDGNIGIGTTSPYAKLSVVGQTVASYFTATSTTASTFPYASTTALTVSGTAYIGSLNGPLQANNGLVSATTSVGTVYGGTGLDSSALTGLAQIVAGTWSASSTLSAAYGGTGWQNIQANTVLLGNGAGRIATTSAGTDGYVLALSAGVPTWLATSTLSTITGTLAVSKGGTGQTSFGQGWLNSNGTDLSASTSPTVNYITATSTTATSTFPYLSVTTNSNLGTVVGGTWQGTAIGAQYGGTGQNFSASSGLVNFYSGAASAIATSSLGLLTTNVAEGTNLYWTNDRFDTRLSATTTLPNLTTLLGLTNATTTGITSTNSWLGTIRSGAWNGTAISNQYGGTGLDSSALTGLAQIVSGTWSASSTLSTAFGGTGWGNIQANTVLLGNGAGRLATTSAGTDGYVLALSAGVPTWLATSTLSTITGTLTVAKGGTGQTSFGQGWLNSNGTDLSASTSPTVNYIVATSTTATSTFPYLSVTTNSNLGTVVGGIWQGTAVGDTYLTKSGDWTGTLDTYNGSDLLARANHTGTQGVATLSNYDWTFLNNYGAINLTGSSTKPIWAQGGINASSTSNFVYASTTALTVSGNSYLGTVSSGVWNGTAIGNSYIDDDITLTNLTQITNRAITDTTGTLTVARGGTGQTSFGQGWLHSDGTTFTSSTSPTVAYFTATSTTASTFPYASTTALTVSGNAYFPGSGIWNSSGNVGIGSAAAPGARLELSGTNGPSTSIRFTGTNRSYDVGISDEHGNGNSFLIEDASGGQNVMHFAAGGSQLDFYGELITFNDKTDGADGEYMRISSTGNVGIGTTSPYAKLSVVGETVSSYFTATSTTATSTFAGGMSVAGTSGLTVLQNGNVGIGTTGPGAKLHIRNSSATSGSEAELFRIEANAAGDGSGVVQEFRDSDIRAQIAMTDGTGSYDSRLEFRTANGSSLATPTTKLIIDNTGNVGIGTTSPNSKLTIAQAPGSQFLNLYATGDSTRRNWAITPEYDVAGTLSIQNSAVADGVPTVTRMVISKDGNVGIGTTGPSSNLHVLTTSATSRPVMIATTDGMSTNGNYVGLSFAGATNSVVGSINAIARGTSDIDLSFSSFGTSEALVIESGGNVGIGTTGPSQKLSVSGNIGLDSSSPQVKYYKSSSLKWSEGSLDGSTDKFHIYEEAGAGSEGYRMTIDTAGLVGIGTTAPEAPLDITGATTQGTIGTLGSEVPGLIIQQTMLDQGSGNNLGPMLEFRNRNGGDASVYTAGAIVGGDGGGYSGVLSFFTQPGGSTDTTGRRNKGASLVERMRIDKSGLVGIGTTSPAQLLSVAGHCVTGDTRLRRRRKKKNGEGYDYDEVEIKDIQPGDEIASLNEETGEIVWSRVNALMDMGVKEIYKLKTADGRQIRTTSTHPYLVKDIGSRSPKHTSLISGAGWLDVNNIKKDDWIAAPKPRAGVFIDNANIFYAQKRSGWKVDFLKFKNLLAKDFDIKVFNYYAAVPDNQDASFGATEKFLKKISQFAALKIKPLKYIEIARGKYEKKGDMDVDLSLDVRDAMDDLDVVIVASGDSDLVSLRERVLKRPGKKFIFAGFKHNTAWEIKDGKYLEFEKIRGSVELGAENKTTPELAPGRTLLSLLYSADTFMSSLNGDKSDMVWARVESLEKAGAEQVYDIEVEGTHNFIGNDIVAHNTYLTGGLGAGVVEATNGNITGTGRLSVTSTTATSTFSTGGLTVGTSQFVVQQNSGNVGIGITTPNRALDLSTGSIQLKTPSGLYWWNSPNNDNASMASIVVSDGSDGGNMKFTTNASERMRIDTAGNVGIGTTTPSAKLHIQMSSEDWNNGIKLSDVSGDAWEWLMSGNDLTLGYNGATRIFHESGGGLGIGVGSIANMLDVEGSVAIGASYSGSTAAPANGLIVEGNVGIGTTTPMSKLTISQTLDSSLGGIWISATDRDYRTLYMDTAGILTFNGGDGATINSATLNAAGAWTNASDISYKENIANLSYGLFELRQLQPRYYTMKGSGMPQIGFIAQEVETVIPEVISGTEGSKGISYGNLATLSVSAIKEITNIINLSSAPTTTPSIFIDSNSNVGIGTTTPNYKLQVAGDIAATAFINTSTRDAKKDIAYLSSSQEEDFLNKIKNTSIANYHYNIEDQNNPLRLGLIAEEAPSEILSVDGKGVDVYKMATFTLGGVKALQKEIEKMKIDLTALLAGAGGAISGSDSLFSWITGKFKTALGVGFEQGKICLEDVCVNKTQLKELLEKNNISQTSSSSSSSSSSSISSSSSSESSSSASEAGSSSSVSSSEASSSESSSSSSSPEISSSSEASSSSSSSAAASELSSSAESASSSSEPAP